LDAQRTYTASDIDLWFALSAFADNSLLYEQAIANSSHVEGTTAAGRALVNAARRVDEAMTQARPSNQVSTAWTTIRQQLRTIATDYR
jgi:hypothetical protein